MAKKVSTSALSTFWTGQVLVAEAALCIVGCYSTPCLSPPDVISTPTLHHQWVLWPRGSRNISPPGRRGHALLPGSFPAEKILRHELFMGGCPQPHPHRTGQLPG